MTSAAALQPRRGPPETKTALRLAPMPQALAPTCRALPTGQQQAAREASAPGDTLTARILDAISVRKQLAVRLADRCP